MTTKPPISVCMVASAEAQRIRRALDSVADWASEIIVVINEEVDDGTDQIAASYGARVFREPWKGFAGQKNSASAKATQDWLFGLDADEEVSPALRDKLIALFKSAPGCAAYEFPRCTLYYGRWIRHGDWYPDRQTRLWRRGSATWGGVEPHAVPQVQGTVGRLRGDLLHYSMETYDHQTRKAMTYADDFARECVARGKPVRWIDIVFRPSWRFFRSYVLRRGFLDGWQGYVIARMIAFYTLLRYLKAREALKPTPSPGTKLKQ